MQIDSKIGGAMRFLICALSFLLIFRVDTAMAVEPDAPEQLISAENAIGLHLQTLLSDDQLIKDEEVRLGISRYYQQHNYEPIWISRSGPNDRIKKLKAEVHKADDYGLRSADYVFPKLPIATSPWPEAAKGLAQAEIKFSLAAVTYGRDARGGRVNPKSLSGYLDVARDLPEPATILTEISKTGGSMSYLQDLHPKHPEFLALQKKLLAMRGGKKEKTGPKIPPGPTLRLGVVHEQVELLRKRLKIESSQSNSNGEKGGLQKFDEDVAQAVKAFQKRKGLTADGIVGPGTRRALNGRSGNRSRLSSILINMERWRWYPDDMGNFHVRMNIPEQLVRVYKDDKVIHTARTIVGKVTNQTPVFSDEMEHVVFHPFWSVPNSIKVQEILPYLRSNSGWFFSSPAILSTHNLYMTLGGKKVNPGSVNWNSADIRRYHVYQPPGPKNVLGVVKFMFPNKHAVYMHDTIEKHYFREGVRLYSHGCVRIQDSDRFAGVLLGHDKGWSQSQISRFISRGATNRIDLDENIPVYLTYFTAWVDSNGALRKRGDIYGHDSRMSRALGLKAGGRPVYTSLKRTIRKKKKKNSEPANLLDMFQGF